MIRRLKGSQSGEHPLTEQDKRFLGPLRKPGLRPSDRVFGMEPAAFRRMLYRLKSPPELAALNIHPHMLTTRLWVRSGRTRRPTSPRGFHGPQEAGEHRALQQARSGPV